MAKRIGSGEFLDENAALALRIKANRTFSPAAPIDQLTLFAGRIQELRRVIDATTTRGQHVVIFGDRGVGKTSLANIALEILKPQYSDPEDSHIVKVNCSQD